MAVKFTLKPIGPRQLFDVPAGQAAKEQALDELAAEAKALFEKTTRTWTHKPVFVLRRSAIGRTVSTRGDSPFAWVDEGTRAHVITAKRSPYLSFRTGGRPKTKPGFIASYLGSEGTGWVRAESVQHPGTKARGFSKEIQRRIQARFRHRFKQVLAAYQKAARRSGGSEAVGL